MNWIEVPANKYTIRKDRQKSHCQLEISVKCVRANLVVLN